jgi:hypothetical protein
MAGAIARLFVQLGLNKAEFDAGAKDAKASTYSLGEEMKSATSASDLLTGALQAAGLLGAAYLAKEALQAAMDLAVLGAEAARTEDAFMRVARGSGFAGSEIARAMDEATGRTVDDEALMQTATNGMLMGLKLSTQEWANLAEGARYHARLIGQDTETVFSGIVEAISRGQPRMLAALKFPGARDAINEVAEGMDGAASSMTEAERSAALLDLTMGLLSDEQAKFGTMANDMIASTDRMARAWDDAQEVLGVGLGTVVAPKLEELVHNIREAGQGIALFKAMIAGTITPAQFLTATFDQIGGEIRSLDMLFPDAASEGNRFRGTLAGIGADAVTAAIGVGTLNSQMAAAEEYEWRRQQLSGGSATTPGAADVINAYEAGLDQVPDLIGKAMRDGLKQSEGAWESFESDRTAAWDNLQSAVEAALTPTIVTAGDIAATASGSYVEKWDEAARQLEVLASQGMAGLQDYMTWTDAPVIPPEVLAGGEEALKAWAQATADDVRSLFRPDLINLPAAVQSVEDYLADQAARKQTIALVTEAYLKENPTATAADAKKAATALFGDPTEVGKLAAADLAAGVSSAMQGTSLVTTLTASWQTDLTKNSQKLSDAGGRIWAVLFGGITTAVGQQDPTLMQMLAEALAPSVAQILAKQGWYQSGTNP